MTEPIETEPVVLKNLKAKLANINCECLKSNTGTKFSQEQEVQAEIITQSNSCVGKCSQVNHVNIVNDTQKLLESITKDVLCPRCFLTMSILRGGTIKIMKDQEVDVKPVTFCCDKATENEVKSVERSSSVSVFLPSILASSLSLCDIITETTSATSVSSARHDSKVTFNDQVALFEFQSEEKEKDDMNPCDCIEKFVNSIRPPLDYDYAFQS